MKTQRKVESTMRHTSRSTSVRSFLVRGAAALALAVGIAGAAATPAAACNQESYTGTVCTFGFDFCPRNWVAADGRLLAINSYQALYALFGTAYGGDGRTTFGIPDLRGRSAVGTGSATTTTTAVSRAEKIGNYAATFAVPLLAHSHTAALTNTGSTTNVTVPAVPSTLGVTASLPLVTTATGTVTKTPAPVAGNQNYIGAASATVKPGSSTISADFTGLFSTSGTTPAGGATSPVTASIDGSPGNPTITVPVPNLSGVGVNVGATGTPGAAVTLPIQSPGLGMTTCVMAYGIFPDRP